MSDIEANNQNKTRPEQLMAEGADSQKALQGFLHIMGYDPGRVDGVFKENSIDAYNQARNDYDFLPELNVSPDQASIDSVMKSIDGALQSNVEFQRQYVVGINSAEDTTQLQGALVAGGSWANRHLGDRISEAEPIAIDGERGILTERGVRNGASLTGVSNLQSSLNLLTGTELEANGVFDPDTNDAMRSYAENNGIELTDNAQDNFVLVTDYIAQNEGDNLRAKISETLNSDEDYSAPAERTRDAQIVMNGLARQNGSDTRTAPDARQTDQLITAENSHTRTVIAPETGVELTNQGIEIVVTAPMLNQMYEITRNSVLADVETITDAQRNDPESAQAVLAYSDEARGFVLITNDSYDNSSTVYQVSDQNVANIMSQVEDGSIAIDTSASKVIAEKMHGNSANTSAYSGEEIRAAFIDDASRYTGNTRESLLTAAAEYDDGTSARFSLDDLHDAADKMDSRSDWGGAESGDPEQIQTYVKELRQAAEDAREERDVTPPQWTGGDLDATNSVDIQLGEHTVSVPKEVWAGLTEQMATTESAFSQGRDISALRVTSLDDDIAADALEPSATAQVDNLTAGFDRALAAQEPLHVADVEIPADSDPATSDPALADGVDANAVVEALKNGAELTGTDTISPGRVSDDGTLRLASVASP